MRSIREHMQFGTAAQKRSSQTLKSRLHRKVLYYLGKLTEEGVLQVSSVEAHGEKIYRVANKSLSVQGSEGAIQITQHTPKTRYLHAELESGAAILFEEHSCLSHFDAFYLDCNRIEGLGQLTRTVEIALRAVHDVVALGDFQTYIQRYPSDDLREFLNTLVLQTLDEARSVCLLLDTRQAEVSSFVQLVAAILPKRVYIVFICNHKTVLSKDFQRCIEMLQERHEKVNVHFAPMHPLPLFIGRAGVYGIQEEEWQTYTQELSKTIPGFIVSQATIGIDMKKLERLPAHEVRDVLLRAGKTLYSIASQQRLVNTGVQQLRLLHPETYRFFQCTSVYLRFWNYNWETPPAIIDSGGEELRRFVHTQQTIYRACGLPFHFDLQLSSAFSKLHKGLSARNYKKYSVNSTHDTATPSFNEYTQQRLHYLQVFGNVDRFRVFRGGAPSPAEVAHEILKLSAGGLPFVTIDFQQLASTRKLTEYFH